jgi:ABC-type glucose/galactose transport system permease subunit
MYLRVRTFIIFYNFCYFLTLVGENTYKKYIFKNMSYVIVISFQFPYFFMFKMKENSRHAFILYS